MNASLPVSPRATDSAGGIPGLDTELQGLHGDSAGQSGFAPLLEEAHAAISTEFAVAPWSQLDAESLLRQVQNLPQAGKLLPLLEQVLDEASAIGVEPRQILQRIVERLHHPGSEPELNPAASLVTALHQLLDDMPALKTPAVADALALLDPDGKASKAALAQDPTTDRSLPQAVQRRAGATEAGEKLPVNEAQRDPDRSGLDKALEQARPGQAEQRQADLAGVMATLKQQLTKQGKAAQADSPLRAESVTVSVTSPTAQLSGPATSALPTLSVNTPLAQGGWDQALGERIQWMVNREMQGAQIKLNPAQLGPMEVRIQVQNDQASILFSSAHSVVREALEAALPRLRDMFHASGVELVDVDVSGQSFAGQQSARGEDGAVARGVRMVDGDSGVETALATPVSSLLANGRLDLFA